MARMRRTSEGTGHSKRRSRDSGEAQMRPSDRYAGIPLLGRRMLPDQPGGMSRSGRSSRRGDPCLRNISRDDACLNRPPGVLV